MLIIDFLIEHDISVQYLSYRDLLENTPEVRIRAIRRRLGMEGWAKDFIDRYDAESGTWGGGWYSPKWISTHYTLMTLMDLAVPPSLPVFMKASEDLIEELWVRRNTKTHAADICISAMLLNLYSYSGRENESSREIVDYLLEHKMPDGGFNCEYHKGSTKSSVHSTLTTLEAFQEYLSLDSGYRSGEIEEAIESGIEFLLKKRLFKSETNGEIFDERITRFSFPNRWRYDVLRAMTFLARISWPYDERMDEALDLITGKQRADGTWPNQEKHAGQVFFDMENPGEPSGYNTYRALVVLKKYRPGLYHSIVREDYGSAQG